MILALAILPTRTKFDPLKISIAKTNTFAR